MWLLHATELRLQQFSPDDVPKYAILSHRWEQEEVAFQDMKNETSVNSKVSQNFRAVVKEPLETDIPGFGSTLVVSTKQARWNLVRL
jgi:hypothetical protein